MEKDSTFNRNEWNFRWQRSDREMYKKFEIKTTFGYGNRMEKTKS